MVVISLTIIIISTILIVNKWYKNTAHYRSIFADVDKFGQDGSLANDLEIVNIGSNQPKYGFDWSVCKLKGANCAVGPQAFEYDFIVLKHLSTHLAKGAVVVIPICPLSFFIYRFENKKTYNKYYKVLDADEIYGYSKLSKIFYVDYPILRNPLNIVRAIRYKWITSSLELEKNPLQTEEQLRRDADIWIQGWEQQFNITLPNPKLSEINLSDIEANISILKNMLDYCMQNQLKPVFTILPVTEYLSSQFDDAFISNYILRYLEEANFADAPFLNYLKDDRFVNPELYINSFFMNAKGRKIFTRAFIEDLKKLNLF